MWVAIAIQQGPDLDHKDAVAPSDDPEHHQEIYCPEDIPHHPQNPIPEEPLAECEGNREGPWKQQYLIELYCCLYPAQDLFLELSREAVQQNIKDHERYVCWLQNRCNQESGRRP